VVTVSALTGRVIDVRIEMDGDLHIALQDATGNRPGIVVAEIPAKPQ
jgi:N-acetylglucosamine kinase-like BadF-type ATPase